MDKTLRKTIEKELQSAIGGLLGLRNRKAAEKISGHIADASHKLARKFLKQVPAPPKKAAATKKAAAVSAKPSKSSGKKTAVKKKTSRSRTKR